MDAETGIIDSTLCNFGDIPKKYINFKAFEEKEFDDKFTRKFYMKNPINRKCSPCFFNYAVLYYGLIDTFNTGGEENLSITKFTFDTCFRDLIHALRLCPNSYTENHSCAEDIFSCDYCVKRTLAVLEDHLKGIYIAPWKPTPDWGVAACYFHNMFIQKLFECKMGCIPDPIRNLIDQM